MAASGQWFIICCFRSTPSWRYDPQPLISHTRYVRHPCMPYVFSQDGSFFHVSVFIELGGITGMGSDIAADGSVQFCDDAHCTTNTLPSSRYPHCVNEGARFPIVGLGSECIVPEGPHANGSQRCSLSSKQRVCFSSAHAMLSTPVPGRRRCLGRLFVILPGERPGFRLCS